MKKTYKVEVTRTTYDSMSFDVEANNEEEAYDNAIEIAMEALWGSGNAEYEVETLEEVEEDTGWEERNERQAYINNN